VTLDDVELQLVRISREFCVISQILEVKTATRMKRDPHIVSSRIVAHLMFFSAMYISHWLLDVSPLWVYTITKQLAKLRFSTSITIRDNISQTVSCVATITILTINRISDIVDLLSISLLRAFIYTHCCRALTFSSVRLSLSCRFSLINLFLLSCFWCCYHSWYCQK